MVNPPELSNKQDLTMAEAINEHFSLIELMTKERWVSNVILAIEQRQRDVTKQIADFAIIDFMVELQRRKEADYD